MILNQRTVQYSGRPQTPLPTTRPGPRGRDCKHSRREFEEHIRGRILSALVGHMLTGRLMLYSRGVCTSAL